MGKGKIVGIILWCIALIGLIGGKDNITEALPPAIIFFIIGLFLIIRKPKTKEEKQQSKENAKRMMETKLNRFNAKHQAGLPIAKGVDCTVSYGDEKFTFMGGGNTFNLSFNKITDACIKTETQIQKQYVSVGGRAKQKELKTTNRYLIFTYLKDEAIDYISFDVTKNWAKVDTIINKFKKNNKIVKMKTIEL